MQEEVNEKTISLCVQCSRMTASVLKAVMRKSLNDLDRKKQKHDQVKQAEKMDKQTKKAEEKNSCDRRKRRRKGNRPCRILWQKELN